MAFMPFITAGDPDLEATKKLIAGLGASGVDLIEIGFPYSDPIADGPVIQASYTRALGKHVTVAQIMQAVSSLDTAKLPPLLAMVSYAIVFRHGPEQFLKDAKAAGFSGLIIPDLPGDEAAEMFALVQSAGLDLVQLVAPTTPRQRVKQIIKSCSGFVYCIAVSGTTGERTHVREALLDQLRWLRQETTLPLAVGFGISQPEHVQALKGLADGAIVGSAIVRQLQAVADGKLNNEAACQNVGELSTSMVAACHR
jgi:tryptophan synthase alpha chain